MNTKIKFTILFTLLGILLFAGSAANSATTIDVGFFHDRLAPYGQWDPHERYGWVWRPTVVEVDWRPYMHGHWAMTDEYGWVWVSDYDWGWACFHYGRWAYDDVGWFWVPGYEWGPAWVTWRDGGGFIGWAPLPPEIGWEDRVGLQLHGFDLDHGISRMSWVFVEERDFLSERLREVIVERARNVTIFEKTQDITKYKFENGRIVNRSISVTRIEKATGHKVQALKVRDVDRVSATVGRKVMAGTLNVFHPTVQRSPAKVSPPTAKDTDRIRAARQAIIEEQHREELDRMASRHKTEIEQPKVNRDQPRQQQEAERRTLGEKQRQENEVFQRQMRPSGAVRQLR